MGILEVTEVLVLRETCVPENKKSSLGEQMSNNSLSPNFCNLNQKRSTLCSEFEDNEEMQNPLVQLLGWVGEDWTCLWLEEGRGKEEAMDNR